MMNAIRRYLGLILFILMICGLLAYGYVQKDRLLHAMDQDPMHLLPTERDAALIKTATQYQTKYIENKVILTVNSGSWDQTVQDAQALDQQLTQPNSPLKKPQGSNTDIFKAMMDFYAPHQGQILTHEQKEKVSNHSAAQLAQETLENALRPVSATTLSPTQDPLGNLGAWLMTQSAKSPLSIDQGMWQINQDDQTIAVLFYEATDGAFNLNTDNSTIHAIEQAKQTLEAQGRKPQIMMAGIPLHSAIATEQASNEISIFGTISLVTVIILVWLAFRRFSSILLVSLSLAVGFVCAYILTVEWFGSVHVVTLVFGTSLSGVAEDYGIHYISARQGMPQKNPWQVLRHVWMALLLALVTSMFAYVCLAIPPFPGLRQIAVFSCAGLIGAFITVVLLFPYCINKPVPETRFNRWLASTWEHHIQAQYRIGKWLLIGLFVFLLAGISRLTIKDSLYAFQNSPAWLIDQQKVITQQLKESIPQFYIVTGDSAEILLQHEENLRTKLDTLIGQQQLGSYRAVSEWLPSQEQQQTNLALTQPKEVAVRNQLGMESMPTPAAAITPEQWLASPISEAMRHQWLGQQPNGQWASIVTLQGVSASNIATLKNVVSAEDRSVLWVDKIAAYTDVMSTYRNKIAMLLVVAYIGTLVVLWVRYRRHAFYMITPPLLASLLTIGLFGWLNIPIQIFSLLPLLLALGMGIDYTIFLAEHPDERKDVWVTITIGAVSTILSLGILAFSSTPAIKIIGIGLGSSMFFTWLCTAILGKVKSTTSS